jgi:hypothetical protein
MDSEYAVSTFTCKVAIETLCTSRTILGMQSMPVPIIEETLGRRRMVDVSQG